MTPAVPCPDESGRGSTVPCALTLFGATGDLTHRKILPALFSLHQQGFLPKPFALVAFARRDYSDESYRAEIRRAVSETAPGAGAEGEAWDEFASSIRYVHSNLDDPAGYGRLSDRLSQLDAELGLGGNRLFYVATPPDSFEQIVTGLGGAGLNRAVAGGWSRVIVEKPFGTDLESARHLNTVIGKWFGEEQIYRIDHYLGKETVQNILVFRFANKIFEPVWNSRYVDSVTITVAETLGMEGRGVYFDAAGITRDMVQNHALQVLTLVAMEPPVTLAADAIRDEKVKVLSAMRPFTAEEVAKWTVRGQYGAGTMPDNGEPAVAYRAEPNVPPDSDTETFAAFRFAVDNWRWSGVPFYVRAGKRLPRRTTEVEIRFKPIPEVLFARQGCEPVRQNRLTIRIQPEEGASLEITNKVPGPEMQFRPVRMDFQYGSSFDAPVRDAYERLLLDAMRGDASLFARNDEVEAAWGLITPILEAWRHLSCPLFPNYAAGTWGPEAASRLLEGNPVGGAAGP